jgi:predicted Zn-dependent protease
LDPQYADTSYLLGTIELKSGSLGAARQYFVDAEHWDALRFRPDPRINEIIREIAREGPAGVHLLDAALVMGSDSNSSGPVAGRELFFEHVHFDWEGNYQLGLSMAEAAEGALFGATKGAFSWLDSKACAAALAYTDHERLSVLQKAATILQNPPFTNQLTYSEDQARLARDLAFAKTEQDDPGSLGQAKKAAEAAAGADNENADLTKIEEGIDDDLGDVAGALAQARRAEELQPANFALTTDEAIKLSRLGRYDEAEALLRKTAVLCPPRDLAAMAPAFADLFTRTKRFEEGRRYLDAEIARRPLDQSLRLVRARLDRFAGDAVASEREYRAVLADEPGNQAALESLLGLLAQSGRSDAAENECLFFLDRQPRNLANNLRASIIYDTRHDDMNSVRCMLAAERSGHVTAAVEVRLAQKLFGLQKIDETLAHLALARRISLYEGDPAATASIVQAIDRIWSQLH